MQTDRFGYNADYYRDLLKYYQRELSDWDTDVSNGIQKQCGLVRSAYVDNINFCQQQILNLS